MGFRQIVILLAKGAARQKRSKNTTPSMNLNFLRISKKIFIILLFPAFPFAQDSGWASFCCCTHFTRKCFQSSNWTSGKNFITFEIPFSFLIQKTWIILIDISMKTSIYWISEIITVLYFLLRLIGEKMKIPKTWRQKRQVSNLLFDVFFWEANLHICFSISKNIFHQYLSFYTCGSNLIELT